MPHPVFQKFVEDMEVAVSAWENTANPYPLEEHDFYSALRWALDAYYVAVAGR